MNDPVPSQETVARLTRAIEQGKDEVPDDRPLLVCKPHRIESWRIFKIMSEFVEGFDVIRRYGLAASFFGSARTSPDDQYYKLAKELATKLSKRGFAIITGGAAGIMQAANQGAYEAGGASVGLNIHLLDEQPDNKYLTDRFDFDHFFVRKVMLTYASEVYIYFPGGFGTLDEFLEIVTLVQTKKVREVPIVLFDREYWTPLLSYIEKTLYEKNHTINQSDLNLYRLVDTVDEAYEYIIEHVEC